MKHIEYGTIIEIFEIEEAINHKGPYVRQKFILLTAGLCPNKIEFTVIGHSNKALPKPIKDQEVVVYFYIRSVPGATHGYFTHLTVVSIEPLFPNKVQSIQESNNAI
jgi:hypothetical protein